MGLIYFSFENKVKKLYLYIFICFILIISYSFLSISFVEEIYYDDNSIEILYIDCFGRILLLIPFYIYKLYSLEKNNCKLNDFTTKDWIIFILIIIIDIFYNASLVFFCFYKIFVNAIDYSTMTYIEEIFIMICLSLLMRFVTSFNFYSHHIFSLIFSFLLIFIFGIISIIKYSPSLISNIDLSLKIIGSIILIFKIFFISLTSVYQKYLIEQKMISFCLVGFFFGFIDFIILVAINSIFKINQKFNKNNALKIIISILYSLFLNFLLYRVIFEYDIIYAEIIFFILNIINSFVYLKFTSINHDFLILFIIESILILICLLIYLEIIELNFCGLNNNTIRNILVRETNEQMELDKILAVDHKEEEPDKIRIEMAGGYIVDFDQENEIEEINNNK